MLFSFQGLKAVLLHKQKKFPAVPIAYSTEMNESYENMKIILDKVKYNEFQWRFCSDLKVVALVSGMQTGNTKFSCFLCEWDSRLPEHHYNRKVWPPRKRENEFMRSSKLIRFDPFISLQHSKLFQNG